MALSLRGLLLAAREPASRWARPSSNPAFKAQNDTLSVYVNPYEIAKFAARLDYELAVTASRPPRNLQLRREQWRRPCDRPGRGHSD